MAARKEFLLSLTGGIIKAIQGLKRIGLPVLNLMKINIVLILLLFIMNSLVFGAVSFDAATNPGYYNGTSISYSHTIGATANCLVAVFTSIVLIYGGGRVVHSAYINERTTAALQWYWYKIYLVLPISGFFIVVFSIETIIKNTTSLLRKSNSD